jgi:phenylalanyl-tRNA synthetase beta chain
MKVPLRWLGEYVDLPESVPGLVERLTLAGLEVGGVRVLGLQIPEGIRVKPEEAGPVWDRDKVLIAEVVKVEPHPDADRLTLPTVQFGQGRVKALVTGAPNIKVGDRGQKVVLALTGSVLFDGHADEKVLRELKPTKIRGIPSDAMVCSYKELGISEEHEGIILLEADAPVGTPLADYMGDVVLEIDVLPNMARCLSMIGVAREVAALTCQKLRLPSKGVRPEGEPIEGQVRVEIADPKLSSRYAAALIRNVKVGPAPGWMQRRLSYAGMRPINNIVDVTNYVMLEWGQPLHAFDHDLLVKRAGDKAPVITVRPARAGEVLTTLDGQKRELTPDNLVIADTEGPIALAGVMGGAETEVSEHTKNILLESANFDFVSIRRTMKQFNLPSEASVRFSKGIHPETVRPAAERAADLMRQHTGGTVARGLVDCYPAPLPRRSSRCSSARSGESWASTSLPRKQAASSAPWSSRWTRRGRGPCASRCRRTGWTSRPGPPTSSRSWFGSTVTTACRRPSWPTGCRNSTLTRPLPSRNGSATCWSARGFRKPLPIR